MSAPTFANQLLAQAKIGIYAGRRKLTPEQLAQKSLIARKWMYTLQIPDGSIIKTDNLPQYCKDHHLAQSTLIRTSPWYVGADPQRQHKRYVLLNRKPHQPTE